LTLKIETEEDTVILEIETVKFFFCESNKDNTNIVVSNGWFDDVIETKNLEPFLHGLAHANCFWANENS